MGIRYILEIGLNGLLAIITIREMKTKQQKNKSQKGSIGGGDTQITHG